MKNTIQSIFSIATMFAVAGGFVVFLLFFVAIIIGGETGESMALFANKGLMPYFIRGASVASFAGLIYFYMTKEHALTMTE